MNVRIERDTYHLAGRLLTSGGGPNPAVLLLHGFPGNDSDVLGIGAALAEAGVDVLTFNYSGTHRSGGEFSMENSQRDIAAALEFIRNADTVAGHEIDTSRIVLGGWSFGGGMALTFAADHPEIRAVFSVSGTDHGEFMREYFRNKRFSNEIDEIFENLEHPSGPVRFASGARPCDATERIVAQSNPNFDLRVAAPHLMDRHVLLIGGWDDANVTMENHVLPLYRMLTEIGAKHVRMEAVQDSHWFEESRAHLASLVASWLSNIEIIH